MSPKMRLKHLWLGQVIAAKRQFRHAADIVAAWDAPARYQRGLQRSRHFITAQKQAALAFGLALGQGIKRRLPQRFSLPSMRRKSTLTSTVIIAATVLFCAYSLYHVGSTSVEARTVIAETYQAKDLNLVALKAVEPAAGDAKTSAYKAEATMLDVEAVLVPQKRIVLSSSYDGKIAEMPFENGERFKKGDVLIRYACPALEAQLQVADNERQLYQKKAAGAYKLFNLDLISDLDRMNIINEKDKAALQYQIYNNQLDDCVIKAAFDGHVTNRLANPGEYTRTDRVLLEVASSEALQAEFLVPSKWLRWVDIGAPLMLKINETDKAYEANLVRIYGEVDPISQSIQMVAQLQPYDDPLLPGMSGTLTIDLDQLRRAGIAGFLDVSSHE